MKLIFILLFFCNILPIFSNEIFKDTIFSSQLRTVKFHKSDDPLSNPVIMLQSGERLLLKFDDLTDEINDYEYQILACNSDWTSSRMFPNEYIDGFQTAQIFDYRMSASQNKQNFVHFQLQIPNEQISIKVSGNYVLSVFKAGNRDSIMLRKRFMVFEPLVSIDMQVVPPMISSLSESHHELRFQVSLKQFETVHPVNELTVTLMQNFRWDNSIEGITPLFFNSNFLQFRRDGRYIFPATKEFRYVDLRNLLVRNERIANFSQNKNDSVYLYLDRPMRNESYRFINDLNGKFLTGSYPYTESDWDAIYTKVVFLLKTDALYRNGSIYLFGQLSNWQISPEMKMQYDEASQTYFATVLLKQGFYNYFYAYVKDKTQTVDISAIEGDYYDAENEYQAFVYYRPVGARYDRLIGCSAINTYGSRRK